MSEHRSEERASSAASGGTGRLPWIVGVSGASGTPYAKAVIRALLQAGHPVDLIVSRAARLTILDETGIAFRDNHWAEDLASWLGPDGSGDLRYWTATDLSAGPASGSYPARGMVVVPASTAAVAGIALGLSKDLLQRAADVTLKERRPLVLMVRETPLHLGHLRTLTALAEMGAVIAPPLPAFYTRPTSVEDLVDQSVGRALDVFGLDWGAVTRWEGLQAPPRP
jgi:4-hydroxy-3-polyprenylbenzoate decarboxylase